MIQRKRYLELCQTNAVIPKSSRVDCDGIAYFPKALYIRFDEKGGVVNVAVLQDISAANSFVNAPLESVKEC